jgi:fibronectin-binding autotransporter adhesin
LCFWDGAGVMHDGAITGGAGTWSATAANWATADGALNGAYDNPAFAVFQGVGAAVVIDGPNADGSGLGVQGMQFAVGGYSLGGDSLVLTEALTTIRVGDGTGAGAAMTATIGSALTGAGTLVKTDLGTLILTGVNSYAGGTRVLHGVLQGDASSIRGDLDNDATVIFAQATDAIFAGAITGDGAMIKRGSGLLTLTGPSALDWSVQASGLAADAASFTGDVAIASGAGFTLTAGTDQTYAGIISGAGLFAKAGAGALVLTADSSGFDGVTEVRDGRLTINGALGGEVILSENAFLGGSGTLASLHVRDGGVVAPGNSIGTLNVAGDALFDVGSTYEVEVDPASSASDLIAVGGVATINGGVVRHIGMVGDYRPSSTYTILTAAGGIVGPGFDDIETDFAFLDATLDHQANAVLMTLARNAVAFPAVGATGNRRASAAGIESTQSGAPLYDAVVGLNADNARLAFDQLSGELHGSVRAGLVADAGAVRSALGRRLRDGGLAGDALAETGGSFWAEATGAAARLGADGNATALRSRSGGLWLGAEAAVAPGVRLGLAGGADRGEYDADWAGEAERETYHLAAYGAGQWGALGVSGGVAAAWSQIETDRQVVFPGVAQRLQADYDATTVQAFAEVNWSIPASWGVIQPFASVARVSVDADGFSEVGGSGALAVEAADQAVTLATLGLGASRAFHRADGRSGAINGRIGWRTASGERATATTQAFAGGADFTVHGLPIEAEALVAELGAELQVRDTLSLAIDWTGQTSDRTTAQTLSATARWRF